MSRKFVIGSECSRADFTLLYLQGRWYDGGSNVVSKLIMVVFVVLLFTSLLKFLVIHPTYCVISVIRLFESGWFFSCIASDDFELLK